MARHQPRARTRAPAATQEQEACDDETRIQKQATSSNGNRAGHQLLLERPGDVAVEAVLEEAFAGEGLVPVRFARREHQTEQRKGPGRARRAGGCAR
jgi:hypothetical protein